MSRGRDASCQRLPHRALVSGNDAKAYQRIGMADTGKRNPPGDQALHHVMIRGIEGKGIFRNTQDPKDFVTRTRIPGWSLLENHFHGFSAESIGFHELIDTSPDYPKSGVDPVQTIHYNEQ